jgi:hypothetical protein
MSLKICNTPKNKNNRQSKLVGTIKCQFKLAGLIRTDTEAKRQLIEKRLGQYFKDLGIFCSASRSPLSINVNKEAEHVFFLVDMKIYYVNESDNAELAAARWFAKIGRMIPKIISESSTWAAEYAGLSTNILPSYLFALEDALGLYETQQISA